MASRNHFICTAYVRNPSRNIDVYGSVNVEGGAMSVSDHLNHGSEITDWFTHTNGGCNRASCAGTRFH